MIKMFQALNFIIFIVDVNCLSVHTMLSPSWNPSEQDNDILNVRYSTIKLNQVRQNTSIQQSMVIEYKQNTNWFGLG